MTVRTLRHLLALVFATAASCVPSTAAELQSLLTDYVVTSWGEKDGLGEGTVRALAQDAAGYLWVGNASGLFRFDGVEFVQFPLAGSGLAPSDVRALCIAGDGSMWVGLGGSRGIVRVRDGQSSRYGEQAGLSADAVHAIVEDASGTTWAGTDRGLYQLDHGRWELVTSKWGPSSIDTAHVSARGDLLVVTGNTVFRRPAVANAFEHIGTLAHNLATRGITVDSSGDVWVSDPVVGYTRLGASRVPSRERGRGVRLLHDRAGSLWVGTAGQGLWRIRQQSDARSPLVQRASSLTGLLGDGVGALLEDRDGNIWAGTTQGVNRVSPRKIVQIIDRGPVLAIERKSPRAVWAATADGLVEVTEAADEARGAKMLAGERVLALHRDRQGRLWAATAGSLVRLDGSGSTVSRWPHSLQQVDSITSNGDGHLWIHDAAQGLHRWKAGQLSAVDLPQAFEGAAVTLNHVDRVGRVWLAFEGGQLLLVDTTGAVRQVDRGSVGTYNAFYEDEQGTIWLGATAGLGKFRENELRTLQTGRFSLQDITAVLSDGMGFLWLGTSNGIARADRAELDNAFKDASFNLRYNLYRRSDGIAGVPRANVGSPRVARTEDGRLWFVTASGITIIDPRTLPSTRAVTPVHIVSVSLDQRESAPVARMRIPSGIRSLQIDYGVVDLTSAINARFRYRLDDFDRGWIDAGAHRQASYTNLSPGAYRFRVVTERDDGTWAEPGALWEFSISPTFYQTRWFYPACAGAVAFAVFSAWRLRLRKVRMQFVLLLGERARLSREIHDTLLQSLVGVALQCEALASDVEPPSVTRQRFVRLRKDIEEHIREARQAIWDLRSPKLQQSDLPTVLSDAGHRAVTNQGIRFRLEVTGTERPPSPRVSEQLLRIGQEALLNAVRHARPTEIQVAIHYESLAVHLNIADNGCGFDPQRVQNNGRDHCGLASMKERADEMGGTFAVSSAVGGGTQISVRAPLHASDSLLV
jgi:signal transduction histidine kinase